MPAANDSERTGRTASNHGNGSTNTDNDDNHDRLKSTLWYHIGKIVDEETVNLGVDATPQFIGSLAELTWAQLANIAVDLESFAKHAGRSTIKTDDVMLLARRNEGLEQILQKELDQIKDKNEKKGKNRQR